MKTYQFSEVMEFLERNQDRIFDYDHSMIDEVCGCVMVEFFKSRGFRSGYVSYKGSKLRGVSYDISDIVAEVTGGPEFIGDFHCTGYKGIKSGAEILKNLRAAGY